MSKTAVHGWTEQRLGDLATFGSGGTPSSKVPKYYGGGIPWVSIADMTASAKYVRKTAKTLSSDGLAASAAKLYEPNVVLYAMYASLGECAIAVGRVSSSQAILGIQVGAQLDRDFLYYYLSSIKSQIKKIGQQGTQSNLNAGMVRDFRVSLPPLPEQQRISSAVSAVDDLIVALDRMIAKKQAIKQGMMQQLLTGKTRLPGFSGQWDEVSLGESGTVSGGGVDKTSNPGEATVQLLNYMDVYRAEFIGADTVSQVVTAPPAKISKCTIRAGDVFFTPTSEVPDDIARSAVADCDLPGVVYSYHLVRWRPSGGWDPSYLGFAFATERFRAQASTLAAGSGTRYVVSMPGFRSLLAFRPPIEEQRAIGDLLRDTSLEIELLRRRLAKARAVKVGMMQELLTGRTRLPVEEGAP